MTQIEIRFPVEAAQIEGTRASLLNAIASRREVEIALGASMEDGNASMLKFLTRERKNAEKCDAFSLAYAAANGVNFEHFYVHSRHAGEMFNIYAMPKIFVLMTVLNGAKFGSTNSSDVATVCGTILALKAGVTGGKLIANALNDYMNAQGRTAYASGATQSGSTLRALEALGIVAKNGARDWQIVHAEHFALLAKAAKSAKG